MATTSTPLQRELRTEAAKNKYTTWLEIKYLSERYKKYHRTTLEDIDQVFSMLGEQPKCGDII